MKANGSNYIFLSERFARTPYPMPFAWLCRIFVLIRLALAERAFLFSSARFGLRTLWAVYRTVLSHGHLPSLDLVLQPVSAPVLGLIVYNARRRLLSLQVWLLEHLCCTQRLPLPYILSSCCGGKGAIISLRLQRYRRLGVNCYPALLFLRFFCFLLCCFFFLCSKFIFYHIVQTCYLRLCRLA